MSSSVFQECSASTSIGVYDDVLECVADSLEQNRVNDSEKLRTWLLVICGAMVFFMQTGFAMLCAGAVRTKNVRNTMLKNILDACGSAVAYYAFGYALSYGGQDSTTETTFAGTKNFLLVGDVDPGFFFFQYTFSAACVTIVAGTVAERCTMNAYFLYSILLGGFVYPIVAHVVWSNNGFLSAANVDPFMGSGVVDFAGGAVIHLTGGFTAFIATIILGPRQGRFYDNHGVPLDKPKNFSCHSISLQVLGVFVLWFGWYGFNAGSAIMLPSEVSGFVASIAAVNTTLSAATGGLSALILNAYIDTKRTGESSYDIIKTMNGALSGLVAITSASATVEHWAAMLVGVGAGLVYTGGSYLLVKLRIDDAIDGIPVHMFNGIGGTLATGFWSSPRLLKVAYGSDEHVGWFYSLGRGSLDATLLVNQLACIGFILGWTLFIMAPFFMVLNFFGMFRASTLVELVGLDLAYNGNSSMSDKQAREEVREYLSDLENGSQHSSKNKSKGSKNTKSSSRDAISSSNHRSESMDLEKGQKGSRG